MFTPFYRQKWSRSSLRPSGPTTSPTASSVPPPSIPSTPFYRPVFPPTQSEFLVSILLLRATVPPPFISLLSQFHFLTTTLLFILKIYKVPASIVFDKMPWKFKECSKIETDQRDIKIHLCLTSHENYVLSCAQWLLNICGIESNHLFNTSETFKVIIIDVILFVLQWKSRSYAEKHH